jgi:hypothetical protein
MAAMPWRQAERQAQALQGAWRGDSAPEPVPQGRTAACGTGTSKITLADRTEEKSEDKIIHGFFLSLLRY